MRKITTLFIFCFAFIFYQKGYTQSVDISDFFIVSQSPLNQENEAKIQHLIQDFNAGLKADLTSKGYTLLSNTSSRLYATELYGHRVNFNSSADKVVFGRVLYDDTGRLSFITYFCDKIYDAGRPAIEALRAHTASGHIKLWENEGEKASSIAATTEGLLLGSSGSSFASQETYLNTPVQKPSYTPKVVASQVSNKAKNTAPKDDFLSRKEGLINVMDTPRIISTTVPEQIEASTSSRSNRNIVGHQ